MSIVDRDRFLQCLAKSGVIEDDVLSQWRESLDADADSKQLARDLVGQNLLTTWQAKMLLKGATRMKLGNYVLTDRLAKLDIGDQFAGIHRQLSRDVSILYLSADVTGSPEARKKVFSFGSKLAELDHPNLVHVFDIDEAKDRIYLVSESVSGRSLKEYLSENSSLSCESVARIVVGCLRGLTYAHTKGVVHSGVSGETVVVKSNGSVQLRGLTQFGVRNFLSDISDSATSDQADIEAVSGIARSLSKRISEKDKNTEAFAKLKTALVSIAGKPEDSIAMLEDLVKSESDKHELLAAATLDGASKKAQADPIEPASAANASASATSVENGAKQAEGLLTSLARRNPVALMVASAIGALLLIGGTVLAASHFVSRPAEVTNLEAPPDSKSNAAPKPSGETAAKPKKKSPNHRGARKVERPSFRDKKGALSDAVTVSDPSSVTDPAANKAAIDAIFGSTEKKAAPPQDAAVTKAAPKVSVEKTTETPESLTTKSPSKMASKTKTTAVAAKPREPAAGSEQEFLAAGQNPFMRFVETVDLPEIASTAQVSFGKLILERKHLLGAEILSTPMAHRSKPIFVLNRSGEDRQTWNVGYKKKKKSEPVVVAKLQKTTNELKFNWLPAAAEINAANFLRNCRIKLSTAKHSHWLTLRKPMKIDGFMLGKNQGAVKLDVDIPFMPNPVSVSALLGGIKFERLDPEDYQEKAHLHPAEITPGVPARMYFHKDADRFLSLDVLGDIRKKMVLQAALVMQPSPEQQGVVLKDPTSFPQIAARIRQMAQQAQAESARAQNSKLKKDEKDFYKKAATEATDRAELTGYYEHVIPQLAGKDIPVTITYALNDQHRIVLAYTVETDDTKKK